MDLHELLKGARSTRPPTPYVGWRCTKGSTSMNQDVKNDLWNAVQNAVKEGESLPEILKEADEAFRATLLHEGEPTAQKASESALRRVERENHGVRDPNPPYDDV